MAFSGTSTPRFDVSYDPTFGTPMFGMSDDKTDYFSSSNGKQVEYPFPTGIFGNSPYPTAMDITPPQTAGEAPSNWQDAFSAPKPSIEDPLISDINMGTARIHYGQTTPPDEPLRAPSMDDLQGSFSLDMKTLTDAPSAKVTISGRKSKKQIKAEESSEETDKRSKFLERNRVAASKCRQKKKEYNGNLEVRAKIMERENAELKAELQQLQNEKMRYMMEMSLHTPNDCECHAIHQHVAGFKAQFGVEQPETSTRHQSVVSAVPTLDSTQ